MDAALWWFIAAERAAQVQLIARAAGKPVPIDHRAAVATRERFGTDLAAWVSYQPLRQTVAPAPPPRGAEGRQTSDVNIMNG
ncbi:hypothetical protein [Streptomyces cirratus]|uniref:hypothetical protein n=1 Tax=Streptomyces cirratus TaxID=68187 RepID=UPI0036223634